MIRLFIFVASLSLTLGCSKTPPAAPAVPPETSRASLHRSEFMRDRARFAEREDAKDRTIEALAYALHGRFDWKTLKLSAFVDVKLKRLDLAQRNVVLDSRVDVREVTVGGRAIPFTTADGLLTLKLDALSPAALTEVMTFRISYGIGVKVAGDGEDSSIVITLPRRGDAVQTRTIATMSEPLGVSLWMPCNNVPANRAQFSAEFEMPAEQSLISNGDLISNQVNGNLRTMRYATRYTLPTYLMAWAVGDFESTTRLHGLLPLSVWRRKGLTIDPDAFLADIDATMSAYEPLLGAYPFEKYAVVLLPEYGGGIEHVGVTFEGEGGATQPAFGDDQSLNAHELGHQWYGDLMTIRSWDDLWIKEGMATLLQEEASRRFEDKNHSGRLFARAFQPIEGDAIRDPELAPDAKYTSGPYDRAAWLLTQIRSAIGETRFWEILRENLKAHAYGSVSTDEFLETFHSALGDAAFERVKLAVKAKALPKLDFAGSTAAKLSLSIQDKDTALVVPLELRWYSDGGSFETQSLTQGAAATFETGLHASGKFLVIDPQDRQAVTKFAPDSDDYLTRVRPLLVPASAEGRKVLLTLGANNQTEALLSTEPWRLSAADFTPFYTGLSSDIARYRALQVACEIAERADLPAAEQTAWKAALTPLIGAADPQLVQADTGKGLSHCRKIVGDELFVADWEKLASEPGSTSWMEPKLAFLAMVSTSPSFVFPAATALVWGASSMRSRAIGMRLLSYHLHGQGAYEPPSATARKEWLRFVRDTISVNETTEVIKIAVWIVVDAKDKESLPAIAAGVRSARQQKLQRSEVCAAHTIADTDADAWKTFVTAVGNTSALPESVRTLIADPSKCD